MRIALLASAAALVAAASFTGTAQTAAADHLSININPGLIGPQYGPPPPPPPPEYGPPPGYGPGAYVIDPEIVAFGYADGYWDRYHVWHVWGPGQARWYRSHYGDHFFAYRHDRERDGGWRGQWWGGDRRDHDRGRDHDRHDDRR